ncbi:DUF1127 domain-containing protein [Kaistia adipata]|nr:DUF1127 domain-containing protein [Kaistia adipata]
MSRNTNGLTRWWRQRQARNSLLSMDDRMLRDIGVSRGDIDAYVSGARQR